MGIDGLTRNLSRLRRVRRWRSMSAWLSRTPPSCWPSGLSPALDRDRGDGCRDAGDIGAGRDICLASPRPARRLAGGDGGPDGGVLPAGDNHAHPSPDPGRRVLLGLYATRARARWGPVIILAGVLGYFASTPGLASADWVQLLETLGIWLASLGPRLQRGAAAGRARARPAGRRAAGGRRGTDRDLPRTARRGRAHGQPAGGPGRCCSADS